MGSNEAKEKGAKHIIYCLYGFGIGLLFPIFITLVVMVNQGYDLSLGALVSTHLSHSWMILVDTVPFGMAFFVGTLGKQNDELAIKKKMLDLAQKKLEEKNRLMQVIFDNAPVAYVILNRDFRFEFANRTTCSIAGLSEEELLGRRCYDIVGKGVICKGCPVAKAFVSKQIEYNTKVEQNRLGKTNIIDQVAVPIVENGQVTGVIEIVTNITERLEMANQREEELMATINTLVGLIELKDKYTGGHSQRVRKWAGSIARAMGLSFNEVRDVEIAASLHDIGKIGIAELILNKPAELTEGEYEAIKNHPVVGENTLSGLEFFRNAGKIIRHHHEAYNGSGYPDKLAGEEIPIGARIICVADAYDAMISDRAYRKGMTNGDAIEELRRLAGIQFDPEVVETFIRTWNDDQNCVA